jgi:hypothetical protein
LARTRKTQQPSSDPLAPGHAAYFSPLGLGDPETNRVTGMVRIIDYVDTDPTDPMVMVRNVDNGYECVAFASELEEPW